MVQDLSIHSVSAQDKSFVKLSKNPPDSVSDKVFNLIMDCIASFPDQVEMGEKVFFQLDLYICKKTTQKTLNLRKS